MAVEAPVSKFRKTNLKIYILVLIGFAVWCIYDGYFSDKFIEEHTDPETGEAKGWLVVNKTAPPFLVGAAVLIGVYLFAIKDRKITADENELIISDKKRIAYDSIQKIDKTHFKSKGRFSITYKDETDREIEHKMSDREYDNLVAVLDHLVEKIS
jgi:hypothetical protein